MNLACDRKFRDFLESGRALGRLSDTLCVENGLSIIEKPQHTTLTYDKWLGDRAKQPQREEMRATIDEIMRQKPESFDALLSVLREKGWEIMIYGDEPMRNCLSSSSFANLLFVNVQIGDVRATALFDTGAGMTVIAQSLLHRLRAAPEKEILRAGNNNGVVRALQTAVIPNIRLGDVCMENCKVLVTDDADFALSDENGRIFPAEILLGWNVISRYRWSYFAKDKSLSVSLPEKTAEHLSPEIKQGPVVYPEYDGRCFRARVDTGHTGSILSASWYSRLPDIAYHETEIAGVGSSQYKRIPYVRVLQLRFQNQTIYLRDVDICDRLYGQSAEIEALLGYDFLEGRDWLLERAFRLFP